jgi:hypothetical protein
MPLAEADVTRAAEQARSVAAPGEQVVAVMAAEILRTGVVFLCGLRGPAEDAPLAWVALDAEGGAVDDEAIVREAASLVALCETAEEAAAVLELDLIRESARRALEVAGAADRLLRDALERTLAAADALAAVSDGVRLARAPYLDELGERARALAYAAADLREAGLALTSHLSGQPQDPEEPLARAVWDVLGTLSTAGPPERFTDVIEGAGGAVNALADDVVASLRRGPAGPAGA